MPGEHVQAEQAVLTLAMWYPSRWNEIAESVVAEDFTVARHVALFQTMAQLVAEHGTYDDFSLRSAGHTELIDQLTYLPTPAASLLPRYIQQIHRGAISRRMVHVLAEASEAYLNSDIDPKEVADTLVAQIVDAHDRVDTTPASVSFEDWEVLATARPRPWVIQGVVREIGRVIIVGGEGSGKSTIGWQVGLCLAAGIHPFRTDRNIPAARVLMVDCENDPTANFDEHDAPHRASPLGIANTLKRMQPGWVTSNVRMINRPEGLDLRSRVDYGMLDREIARHRPSLVVAGPLYKMYRRGPNENDETLSAGLQLALDRLRVRYGCAFWLEHHAAKRDGPRRIMEPFGSSLWLRWPDIGLSLDPVMMEGTTTPTGNLKVGRFRGHRYRVPGIPNQLVRGDVLPWAGYWVNGWDIQQPQVDWTEPVRS